MLPRIDIVGEVVEIIEADALRLRIALAEPVEFGVIGRALLAVGVDEIEQRAADADDGRHIERLVVALIFRRTLRDGMFEGLLRVDHAPGHGRRAGAVNADEAHRVRTRPRH
jgi:hypothetical protein